MQEILLRVRVFFVVGCNSERRSVPLWENRWEEKLPVISLFLPVIFYSGADGEMRRVVQMIADQGLARNYPSFANADFKSSLLNSLLISLFRNLPVLIGKY